VSSGGTDTKYDTVSGFEDTWSPSVDYSYTMLDVSKVPVYVMATAGVFKSSTAIKYCGRVNSVIWLKIGKKFFYSIIPCPEVKKIILSRQTCTANIQMIISGILIFIAQHFHKPSLNIIQLN
jgi:hypothetical protein